MKRGIVVRVKYIITPVKARNEIAPELPAARIDP